MVTVVLHRRHVGVIVVSLQLMSRMMDAAQHVGLIAEPGELSDLADSLTPLAGWADDG